MRQFVNLIRTVMLSSILGSVYVYPVFGHDDTPKSGLSPEPLSGQIETKKPSPGLNPETKTGSVAGANQESGPTEIPLPPAVALPDRGRLIPHQTPETLAWRERALSLANEYPLKENGLAWELPVNYSGGQILLKEAAKQTGLTVASEYPEAGQFLLAGADKKGEIIVVSQPISNTRTLFKVHVYSNEQSLDNRRVNELAAVMKDLSKNKDLWQ